MTLWIPPITLIKLLIPLYSENFCRNSLSDRSTLAQQTLVRRTELRAHSYWKLDCSILQLTQDGIVLAPQNPIRQPVIMESNFNTPLGADINILDNYVPNLILLLIPLLQI